MDFAAMPRAIVDSICRVIDGKEDVVETAVVVLLAGGNLLIEDVPGVGKTVLAKALARSVDLTVRRVQFTPDLTPSDIIGVSIYRPATGDFTFQPGAVFANLVIGDEINRASPRTQSALLEAMEEHQVTVDGMTRSLPDPFIVVATQNPYEMEGTFPLPEAQRDRFMARVSMGYPNAAAELEMVRDRDLADPISSVEPVISADDLRQLVAHTRSIYAAPAVEQYAVGLAAATRVHPGVRLGASPRATLQLVRAAKARAVVAGRDFVLPDDVAALVPPVLAHRLVVHRGSSAEQVLADVVGTVPVPSPGGRAD